MILLWRRGAKEDSGIAYQACSVLGECVVGSYESICCDLPWSASIYLNLLQIAFNYFDLPLSVLICSNLCRRW